MCSDAILDSVTSRTDIVEETYRIVVDFILLSKLLGVLANSNCKSKRSLKTVRFRLLAVSGLAQKLLSQNVMTLFSDPTG